MAARLIAMLLAGTLALSACGLTTKRSIDKPVRDSSSFVEVCNRGSSFTDAAPYKGSAPHPIVVFEPGETNGNLGGTFRGDPIPFGDDPEFDPPDAAAVQLIGCPQRVPNSRQDTGRKCAFGGGVEVPLYDISYELKVREATTGNVVASTEIRASGATCPDSRTRIPDVDAVYAVPTPGQYRDSLQSLVGGDR
jgi:hypothetical protein